jgi:5-methylcytosine-specific restriction endonuclease McrA
MKRLRADPLTAPMMRQIGRRAYRNGGAQKQQDRIATMQREQPFRWRSLQLRKRLGWPITEGDLLDLWDRQGGLCALTGAAMDIHDSEVDHIVPRSRGGSEHLSNLRWLSRAANQAKGDLLDEEFVALCAQVSEYISRLILSTEGRGA